MEAGRIGIGVYLKLIIQRLRAYLNKFGILAFGNKSLDMFLQCWYSPSKVLLVIVFSSLFGIF